MKKAGLISLLFDGWTCDGTSTHYIGIFAGYTDPATDKYKETLLAIQPMLKEDDLGADSHIELLESTLELYDFPKENVVCLVGDNCSVNKSISKKMDIPLIGCFNHKLTLAVTEYIASIRGLRDALDKVSTLMSKACCLKAAARLRDLTMAAHGICLAAKKENDTQWTSVFEMAKRYNRIKAQLNAFPELENYTLTPREDRIINNALEDFEVFHSITVEIQACGIDLLHCREQFDILLSEPIS
jgi:hypothetical protein